VIMRKPCAARAPASAGLAWIPGDNAVPSAGIDDRRQRVLEAGVVMVGQWRQAHCQRQIRRADVHGIDARDGEDLVDPLDGLDRLDHGKAGHLLVRSAQVLEAVAHHGGERPEAASAVGRIPAGGNCALGFHRAIDHRDDHAERAGIEHAPDDAGLYERNYLASARTNRTIAHMMTDRTVPYALVDEILALHG